MTTAQKAKGISRMLADPSSSLPQKKQLLQHLLSHENKETDAIIATLLENHAAKNGKVVYAAKIKTLDEMIQAMEEGPVRPGTFLQMIIAPAAEPKLQNRAEVVLPDGTSVLVVVPKPEQIGHLERGDTVLLDAQARAVLARQQVLSHVGEEAQLVRRVDDYTVEIDIEHQGRYLYFASAQLMRGLNSGEVEAGHRVIVSTQRRMAFCGVPPADGFGHYRFLDRGGVPDVDVDRDIASPAPFIGELLRHTRREMQASASGREYRLHRCRTVFLTGVSGSGKTLNILGFTRRLYEVMSEVTGVPIHELPPRVLRLRASEVNSKWYGEAERNVDKFFNEVDALCEERITGPGGQEFEAPVLVIAEEIDGLARERGSGHDNVDDRVQATILQRLDTTARKLRDSLVIVLCTSNVPNLMDPAFVRRAGGFVEHFGRLGRRVFEEILTKQVKGIPFASTAGKDGSTAIADITAWLFGPNADTGVAELIYAGSTQPLTKMRRDFLTGALVERAVQQASAEACQQQEDGCEDPGLTTAQLASAFAEQVQHIVVNLTERNAHHYLDVPRGSRVATVRLTTTSNPIPAAFERGN
jgi:ATP-dependent 26S proteasome regulatory subunit